MTEIVQQGCLVLADISGYTAYLAGVELEHSHDILADLLGTVTDALLSPAAAGQARGRCGLLLLPQTRSRSTGVALLEALESTYLAFARRRRTVALSSSCACDACQRTPGSI